MLIFGDWGENSWELRLGFDRVFWGVAELQQPRGRRQPAGPARAPARPAQAGPAHGAPHGLRRLGRRRIVCAALSPQAHVSGPHRAPSVGPRDRRGRPLRERRRRAPCGSRVSLQQCRGRARFRPERLCRNEPRTLVRRGPPIRVPDPVLRADPAIRARCAADDRPVALQDGSHSARRRAQSPGTGGGLQRLQCRRGTHASTRRSVPRPT